MKIGDEIVFGDMKGIVIGFDKWGNLLVIDEEGTTWLVEKEKELEK